MKPNYQSDETKLSTSHLSFLRHLIHRWRNETNQPTKQKTPNCKPVIFSLYFFFTVKLLYGQLIMLWNACGKDIYGKDAFTEYLEPWFGDKVDNLISFTGRA